MPWNRITAVILESRGDGKVVHLAVVWIVGDVSFALI
jgi:hypothetical protein